MGQGDKKLHGHWSFGLEGSKQATRTLLPTSHLLLILHATSRSLLGKSPSIRDGEIKIKYLDLILFRAQTCTLGKAEPPPRLVEKLKRQGAEGMFPRFFPKETSLKKREARFKGTRERWILRDLLGPSGKLTAHLGFGWVSFQAFKWSKRSFQTWKRPMPQ